MDRQDTGYNIKGNGKSITITLKLPFKEGIDLHGELEPMFNSWVESKLSGIDMSLTDSIKVDNDKYVLDSFEHRLEALESEVFKSVPVEDLPM